MQSKKSIVSKAERQVGGAGKTMEKGHLSYGKNYCKKDSDE